MKFALMGFGFAVLVASIWPVLSLLLSPFLLLLIAIFYRQFFYICFACVCGFVWVNWHWLAAEQQALSVEQGRQQWQLTGSIGRVSQQMGRTDFDYFPSGPFKKLKVSCYKCPWLIESGERWQFALKLKPFTSLYNPSQFDYRQWMLSKGYNAYGSVNIKHEYNLKLQAASPSINKKIEAL